VSVPRGSRWPGRDASMWCVAHPRAAHGGSGGGRVGVRGRPEARTGSRHDPCNKAQVAEKVLKEISNRRPKEVFEFVMERRATMPRTALRYAIEKLPAAMKKRAMARP